MYIYIFLSDITTSTDQEILYFTATQVVILRWRHLDIIKTQTTTAFLFQNHCYSKAGPLWRKRKKPFDVICCLQQSHWLLCVAKNCEWFRKITPLSHLTRTNSNGKLTLENLRLRSTLKCWIKFWTKGGLVIVKMCFICGWWFSNQFDIVSETPYRYDTVGRKL